MFWFVSWDKVTTSKVSLLPLSLPMTAFGSPCWYNWSTCIHLIVTLGSLNSLSGHWSPLHVKYQSHENLMKLEQFNERWGINSVHTVFVLSRTNFQGVFEICSIFPSRVFYPSSYNFRISHCSLPLYFTGD